MHGVESSGKTERSDVKRTATGGKYKDVYVPEAAVLVVSARMTFVLAGNYEMEDLERIQNEAEQRLGDYFQGAEDVINLRDQTPLYSAKEKTRSPHFGKGGKSFYAVSQSNENVYDIVSTKGAEETDKKSAQRVLRQELSPTQPAFQDELVVGQEVLYGFMRSKLRKYRVQHVTKEWRINLDMFHFSFLKAQETARKMKSIVRAIVDRSQHKGIVVLALVLRDQLLPNDCTREEEIRSKRPSPFQKRILKKGEMKPKKDMQWPFQHSDRGAATCGCISIDDGYAHHVNRVVVEMKIEKKKEIEIITMPPLDSLISTEEAALMEHRWEWDNSEDHRDWIWKWFPDANIDNDRKFNSIAAFCEGLHPVPYQWPAEDLHEDFEEIKQRLPEVYRKKECRREYHYPVGRLNTAYMRKPFSSKTVFDEWRNVRTEYFGINGDSPINPGEIVDYQLTECLGKRKIDNSTSVLPGEIDNIYMREVNENEADALNERVGTGIICVSSWVQEALMSMELGEKARLTHYRAQGGREDGGETGHGKDGAKANDPETISLTLCAVVDDGIPVDCGGSSLFCNLLFAYEYFPEEKRTKDVQYISGCCCKEQKKFIGCKLCCKCSVGFAALIGSLCITLGTIITK